MKITIRKIRRNNVYAVIANGENYILKTYWSGYVESLDVAITEVSTGNLWSIANVTDLSERHEMWAEITKAYIKWSYQNE